MKEFVAIFLAAALLCGMIPMAASAETVSSPRSLQDWTADTSGEQNHLCTNYDNWKQLTAPTCDQEGQDQRSCTDCGKLEFRDTRITGDPNKILVSSPLPEDYFSGKNILLIGDSITYGVNTTKTYGAYLAEILGLNVTNKGVSGSGYCSGGAMATNKTLTEANVRNADLVTIMLGVNDWAWSVKDGSWNGNPNYYDKSKTYYQLGDFNSTDTSTFYGAMHSWCQNILSLKQIDGFEDKQFTVITPLITSWNNSVGQKDWNQDKLNIHGHTFREYCTAIMEVCAYYDIPVFDANMFSGIYYRSEEDNNVAKTGGDGVHVNAEGHALLADALAEFLIDHYSYETRTVEQGGHTFVNGICEDCRLPDGCDHTYIAEVTVPTCTEQGYTTYTCACGHSYVDDYTDATGHRYENSSCILCGIFRAPAKAYHWQMKGTELVSVTQNGTVQNNLTVVQGSVNNNVLSKAQLVMETPVVLCYDRPWIVEWSSKGNWDGMLFGSTLESPSDGLTYLFRYAPMRFLAFGEYTGSWNNYGVILDLDMTVAHVFRLENRIAADGSNAVYLLVDGQQIDAMHHYYVGGTNKNKTVNWANGRDIVFANIGTATHPVSGMQLDDLWVWENGHEHSYEKGICTGCGKEDPEYVPLPTLTLKSPTLEFKDMISINAFFTADNTENVVEMGMITYKSKVDEWNVENAAYVIPGATYVEGSGSYYASSQGIHAKQLNDEIYLAVYAKLSDGSYAYSKLVSYSATAYAYNQLEKSDDVKLKQLVVAMLNYGSKAQTYFCCNPENLSNAALTEEQLALPEAYSTDLVQRVPVVALEKQGTFLNNQGFSARKPAVSFEGAFSINCFFTPAYVPVGEITLYYWSEADFSAADVLTADNATGALVMIDDSSGQYRADITGIAAKNLSGAIYAAALYSDGSTAWTSGVLGYSIGAYCGSQAAKGGAVAELAKATAVYGYHAKAYFG